MNTRRKIIIFITVVLFLICSVRSIVYATQNINNVFFTTEKTNVTLGETVTLTLDLTKIEYSNIKFTLFSDLSEENIEEIYVDNENLETITNNNGFSMLIDKNKIDMEKINLYYKISENLNVGTVITLTAEIKENIDTSSEYTNNTVNDIVQENNIQESIEVTTEEQIKVEVVKLTIVENNEEQNKPDESQNEDNKFEDNNFSENGNKQFLDDNSSENGSLNSTNNFFKNENTQQISNTNLSNNLNTNSSQTSDIIQTAVYNGSSNNYLNSLLIEGEELNYEFSKENTTYFLSVKDGIEELEISATAEDESSTVCIYGNTNLQQGTNKILISVTAENGNVRNYRIYVTKN